MALNGVNKHACRYRAFSRRDSGLAVVSVLIVTVIVSIALLGVGTYAVAHVQRAHSDAIYSHAMDAAEAGINYEIWWISNGSTAHTTSSPGTGTQGTAPWTGSYTVACKKTDGTAITDPTNLPDHIMIEATGTVDGASRTVRVGAIKGTSNLGNYGVFSKTSGVINGSQSIYGSVGTAGTVTINGGNGISDKVIGLHGDTSSATINPAGSFTTQRRAAITWPTVSAVADKLLGTNGLSYVQSVNDNSLATAHVTGQINGGNYNDQDVSAAILNGSLSANGKGTVTFHGKPGGANYCLYGMVFNGSWTVTLDNSQGPINIWCVGKNGGSGSFTFNGGSTTVDMTTDSSKACRLYVSDKCNLTLNGAGTAKYGVYAINDSTTGGSVTFNGNNDLYGSVICNKYVFNGSNSIHYVNGYFSAGDGYWMFDGSWLEVNPR